MIETISHAGLILAILVRRDFREDGIRFFTPDDFSQQLGYMSRSAGYVIPPHVHRPVPRTVDFTKEVIILKSGRVRVDFYDDDKNYLESRILEPGDVILLARGGHGFEMLADSEMLEVKQGPYVGIADKERFGHVSADQVVIKGCK
jgi:hypothetical protein